MYHDYYRENGWRRQEWRRERGRKPLQIVHVRNKTVLCQDCRSDYWTG